MSVVVGFVARDEVILGADSIGIDAELHLSEARRDPKVFVRRTPDGDDIAIGGVGTSRPLQLMRHALVLPRRKRGQDALAYLVTSFVDAMRACFADGGMPARDPNKPDECAGDGYMVGLAGRLFRIDEDYSVVETHSGWDAIGAGDHVALGALAAQDLVLAHARRSKRELSYPEEQRVLDALAAAERTSSAVRKPFVIVRARRAKRTKAHD